MWIFDDLDDHFPEIDIASVPVLVELVDRLIFGSNGEIDIKSSVLSPYGMVALPLVEWDVSFDAEPLFDVLARSGSNNGYFVDNPSRPEIWQTRMCSLSPETSALIARNHLFAWDRIFIDDRCQVVISAQYSDFAYLCMQPKIFEEFLANNPIALDLTDEAQSVRSDTYEDARVQALKRLDDWSETPGCDMSRHKL
jgi:hypothetical protein